MVVWLDGPIACGWPQVGLTKGAVVAQKPSNLFYGVQDIPPFRMTLLLGLQHVMVMSVTLILPVLIVQAMGGTPAQAQSLIRMSLIAGGSYTLIINLPSPLWSAVKRQIGLPMHENSAMIRPARAEVEPVGLGSPLRQTADYTPHVSPSLAYMERTWKLLIIANL